jgi:signal transduction histidine kinase
MKLTLFRRQLLIFLTATLVFALIGVVASGLLLQRQRNQFESSLLRFLARYADATARRAMSLEEAIHLMAQVNQDAGFPNQVKIVDQKLAQEILGPNKPLPTQPYQIVEYGENSLLRFPGRLIGFSGENQKQYLIMRFRPESSPLGRLFVPNVIVMFVAIVFGSLFSIFLVYLSMRTQALMAANIFSEIRNGNLKARFPMTRIDDMGQLMGEFNKMADEIERLVETIRSAEITRMRRLQELAHDLRTPVASLKNLLETFLQHHQGITGEKREEILSLSLKEVDYFARLVEDVLFLAQVSEPKYSPVKTMIDLPELLADELETLRARYPEIKVVTQFPPDGTVKGDLHLLRRLFRNAFENAFSFARDHVEVEMAKTSSGVSVSIRDDGKGFSESDLNGFGEKRITRIADQSRNQRISVGLGSMIMKAVVAAHGGSLQVRNRRQNGDVVAGAEVEISLSKEC